MTNVLLIEPNTLLATTYRQLLEHAGFAVTVVLGAQAAINAADKCAPHIVVMELQLAGHSGLEFLHEFRSYSDWQRVPVIVHTVLNPTQWTFAREPLQRELGVTAFLYKPQTSLEELLRRVRAALAKPTPQAASPA